MSWKKQDPVSGLTIDIPDQAPPLGKFPYSGFWAQVYGNLPSALEARTGFSKFDISTSLKEIEAVANGPFSVIVGEKLWKVGELLALNQYIAASGQGGTTLDYVAESRDGGRIEIAAICLEPIINSILQRASLSGRVGAELGELEKKYQQKLEVMRALVQRMSELEEAYLPLKSLEASRSQYEAAVADYNRLDSEVQYVGIGLEMVKQTNAEIRGIETELRTAERQHKNVIQQIEHWQDTLRTAEANGNGSAVAKASEKLTSLGKANAELARTISGLGQKLMRLNSQDTNPDAMKESLKQLQKNRNESLRHLNAIQKDFIKLEKTYTQTEAEMSNVRSTGSKLSYEIERLATQIEGMKTSQQTVVAENESEIVRLWVNHLSGVYRDAESYIFHNLRLAQESAIGAQGSSIYMQKAINAEKIAEMENFLSSVDMISDYLDADEVDVLEQIARLGTAMNYLPGTSRVMALRDMSYGRRKDAYRNMIDEILEFGTKESEGQERPASVEAFGFKFTAAEPLHEVASLLRHLTDTLLEGS